MSSDEINNSKIEIALSNRQKNLLYAVVKEYCEFGATVSSRVLKDKYGFNISPATIRNEFSKLRDMGFLYQPFTNSSSRPTEKAFKLFVNELLKGLQISQNNQNELRSHIHKLQDQQNSMQKEISKLLAMETSSIGFAMTGKDQNISGIKNMLMTDNQGQISDLLDFLENMDQHKKILLEHENEGGEKLATFFGSDNPILPLGKGYAMVSAKAKVNNVETVFGIITQPHILGRKKTLQIINAITKILNDQDIDIDDIVID